MRKQRNEESYADKVETIQNEKFEQIKKQAINYVNTESVFLKPGVIRNYQPRDSEVSDELNNQNQSNSGEENQKEEEPQVPMTKEQKLWSQLGTLLGSDRQTAQALRQDKFEVAEISLQAKKELTARMNKNKDDDFECRDDGFMLANTQITVVQGKAPKRKRKGGRH